MINVNNNAVATKNRSPKDALLLRVYLVFVMAAISASVGLNDLETSAFSKLDVLPCSISTLGILEASKSL
jgi:hypothetical protein